MTDHESSFPKVDKNHEISEASKELLLVRKPSTWIPTSMEGTNDFGFDIHFQLGRRGEVSNAFLAQLKGTESPSISADGSILSISLKNSTLNLYANAADPVMLIVAVVRWGSANKPDHSTSKVYWHWIDEELRRIRGSAFAVDSSDQKSVTVHVPTSQELDASLDVLPYIQQRISRARMAESLADLMAKATSAMSGQPQDSLQRLIKVVTDRPGLLLSVLGDQDAGSDPMPDSPLADIQSVIDEAASFIRSAKTALAEKTLARIDRAALQNSRKLQASVLNIEGKIAMQRMRKMDALTLFREAYQADPLEKYLLAAAENAFLIAIDNNDQTEIARVAESLVTVRSDDGRCLRVQLLVSLSDFKTAAQVVDEISLPKRALPRLILLSAQAKWKEVQVQVEEDLSSPGLSASDSVSLQLVAARACWRGALSAASIAEGQTEVPLPGPPGLDVDAAWAAWRFCEACLVGLKELGWPLNVDILAPIAAASASAIGANEKALALLEAAAMEKPQYSQLQEHLELLAIVSGNTQIALDANLRQPISHSLLVKRACLYFQNKNFSESVDVALQVLSDIANPCPQTPLALAMGAAAASKIVRVADCEKLIRALSDNPAWGEFEFFSRFLEQSVKDGTIESRLAPLHDGLTKFPFSRLLASNLYSNLRADDVTTAQSIVSLSILLRAEATLTLNEWLQLISAHLTLEQWASAEYEARLAIARFGAQNRLQSVLAVALELQGKTGEAIELLESTVSYGRSGASTLRNYLGICLRLGRMEAASQAIEKLLAIDSRKEDRLELLRLKTLILVQQGAIEEAIAVVSQVGKLVDPTIEHEEGMYLNLWMAATLKAPQIAEEDKIAFGKRIDAFTAKWPESTSFRQVEMPAEGPMSLDDLHNVLDKVIGDSRQKLQDFQTRERLARAGSLPIPFVARPGYVFHYIGDCFTLWEVAKRSTTEERQYHLISFDDREAQPSSRLLREIPLLELTALLVLGDLGLLENSLAVFKRIAIPKTTVDYISQHARGLLIGETAAKSAGLLLGFINSNLEKIEQPSTSTVIMKAVNNRDVVKEYINLAKSGRWAIYTDDVITRALISIENQLIIGLCTVDFLRVAVEEGNVTETDEAMCLAKLCEWNVGIRVFPRPLIASLSGALDGTSGLDASSRLERFYEHPPFAKLARAVWGPEKPPAELIKHMGALLAKMLENVNSEIASVAAVWAFWFIRVRVSANGSQLGWDYLCYSLLFALQQIHLSATPRALDAFLKVVEVVIGSNKMTKNDQRVVLGRLGEMTASLAGKNAPTGGALLKAITTALPLKTEYGDFFYDKYLAALNTSKPQNGH